MQRVAHALVAADAFRLREGVDDVRGEVDAEAGAHDEVDHGHGVEVDTPPRHVADDADARRHDARRHQQTARERRHQQQRDDEHGGRRCHHVLACVRPHCDVLVVEDERRVEHGHVQVDVVVGDATRRLHQLRLLLRRIHVFGEHEEARLLHLSRISINVYIIGVFSVTDQERVQLGGEVSLHQMFRPKERPKVARPRDSHIVAMETIGRLERVDESVDHLAFALVPQFQLGADDDVYCGAVLPEILDLKRVEVIDVWSVACQLV